MTDNSYIAFKKYELYECTSCFEGFWFVDEHANDHRIAHDFLREYFLNEDDFKIFLRKEKLIRLNKKKF
jgi:hypothetical protein